MQHERFPAQYRLRHAREFQQVYRHRQSVADSCLVVYARPNELNYSRLGLSVSRRVGNAVVRNRWKRWIRESFRQQNHQLPSGLDLVVIPRQLAHPQFAAVWRSLPKLAERIARRLR